MLFFSGKKNSSSLNQHFKKKKEGKKAREGETSCRTEEEETGRTATTTTTIIDNNARWCVFSSSSCFFWVLQRALSPLFFSREKRDRENFPTNKRAGERDGCARVPLFLSLFLSRAARSLFSFARLCLLFKCFCARELTRSSSSSSFPF
jgi:hypothetical protein